MKILCSALEISAALSIRNSIPINSLFLVSFTLSFSFPLPIDSPILDYVSFHHWWRNNISEAMGIFFFFFTRKKKESIREVKAKVSNFIEALCFPYQCNRNVGNAPKTLHSSIGLSTHSLTHICTLNKFCSFIWTKKTLFNKTSYCKN